MERYSKKRQSIIDLFKSSDAHPSAEYVYNKLKPLYPDLSLGTVYRNIGELIDEGIICSVGTVNGKERFDGNTLPHTHLICEKCGKVFDAKKINALESVMKEAESIEGFSVKYSKLQFYGICEDCKKDKR